MAHAALPRACRLTEMLDLLRLKPHSSRELATHFKVGIRTIQRDLEILQEDGEALQLVNEHQYQIRSLQVTLNPLEGLALLATAGVLVQHMPTQQRLLLKVLEKLTGLLPEPLRGKELHFLTAASHRNPNTRLETLLQACLNQQQVSFRHHPHEGKKRTIQLSVQHLDLDPRTLDVWVIGHEHPTQKPNGFLMSQMHQLTRLPDVPAQVEAFEPGRLRHTPCGSYLTGEDLEDVTLNVFSHLHQQLRQSHQHWGTFTPNHEIHQLTFQVPSRLLQHAVLPWVLSLGGEAQILAPRSLREQHDHALRLVPRDHSIPMTGKIMRLVQQHPGDYTVQELSSMLFLGEHHSKAFFEPLLEARILRRDEAGKVFVEGDPPISNKGGDMGSFFDRPPRFGG